MKTITSNTGITAEWVALDRTSCEALIEALPKEQRSVKAKNMLKLKSDIESNRWRPGADTIVIDNKGQLLDGQHRIKAFLMTGYFPQVLMIRNVPTNMYKVIDTGASRSWADHFKAHGVPNYNLCAAITAKLILLENQHVYGGGYCSSQDLLDLYDQRKQSINYWRKVYNPIQQRIKLPQSIKAAVSCYAEQYYSRHTIELFWNATMRCIGEPKSVPVMLYEALLSNASKKKSKERYSQNEIMHLVLKAMHKQVSGQKKVGMLKVHGTFPYLCH